MISVSPILVLGFLEALLFLVALAAWLYWKVRRQAIATPPAEPAEPAAPGARPQSVRLDVGNYLGEELEQTRARLHHPVPEKDAPQDGEGLSEPPAWLVLRAEYLQLELDFANHEHHDEQAWETLVTRLREMLERHVGYTADQHADADSGHDAARLNDLLHDQVAHIDDLHGFLKEVVVHPEKVHELKQHIGRITRANQELAGCVAVLEGENDRLWRQIEVAQGAAQEKGAPAGADAAAAPAGEVSAAPAEPSPAAGDAGGGSTPQANAAPEDAAVSPPPTPPKPAV
ncbi:hypothetical protein BMS3Abin12_01172 [bacterium BMS3Abin12]|nr:hypothetical protein BMS3Abin12_01172 [bacterium BMS3Abin12]